LKRLSIHTWDKHKQFTVHGKTRRRRFTRVNAGEWLFVLFGHASRRFIKVDKSRYNFYGRALLFGGRLNWLETNALLAGRFKPFREIDVYRVSTDSVGLTTTACRAASIQKSTRRLRT